jgi:hypothetical protein
MKVKEYLIVMAVAELVLSVMLLTNLNEAFDKQKIYYVDKQ